MRELGYQTFYILIIALFADPLFAEAPRERIQSVIDEVRTIYEADASSKGLQFLIEIDQKNSSVAASADRFQGVLRVILNRGLIESARLSEDGLRFIICHEVGHLYGGAPRRTPPQGWRGQRAQWGTTWFSAEGAADYYASAKCMRNLLKSSSTSVMEHQKVVSAFTKDFQKQYQLDLHQERVKIKEECDQEWSRAIDSLICQRASLGGLNMFLLVYDFDISFSKRAKEVPAYTLRDQYPSRQCRLDTARAGALCKSDFPLEFHFLDPLETTCENSKGLRPRCWFIETDFSL